ncbi:MAG: malonic semialdehyde reductase [Candidatus Nanopelagicales bacterium]
MADIKDILFNDAHTAYSFTGKPVSDTQLTEIYDLVKFAPTPMNTQALRIEFVRTVEGKERLISLLAEGNRAKSASASAVAILAFDTNFHDFLPENFPQVPHARDLHLDEEKRVTSAREIAILQAGYFILAVRSVGLDAGPMLGFDAHGVNAEFFVGTSWRSLYVVNIGHAAEGGQNPRNPRLNSEIALRWS